MNATTTPDRATAETIQAVRKRYMADAVRLEALSQCHAERGTQLNAIKPHLTAGDYFQLAYELRRMAADAEAFAVIYAEPMR